MSHATLLSKSLKGIVWSADLVSAARAMKDENIGALGVYSSDGHDLLGVITERDISHAVAQGLDLSRTRVGRVMTDTLLTAEGPITLEEASNLMHAGHVRHLIIRQDGSDRIVSIRDL